MEEGNDDAEKISRLLQGYKVFARHGDYYDPFNFDIVKGRDYATLGDVFTMEVCNRFSPHLGQKRFDPKTGKLSNDDTMGSPVIEGGNTDYVKELRQITNIRPALATPLWVTGQLKRISQDIVLRRSTKFDEQQIDELLKKFENAPKGIQRESKDLEAKLKEVWDELVDQFMHLDFIRNKDKWGLDVVDKMQLVITISKTISSKQLDELVYMMQNRNATGSDHSFARFALEEPAFNRKIDPAKYIVYGHTHHHEIVPIDYDTIRGKQMYFNSGTWHTYFDLARKNPKDKKFIPYKALTYITFYRPSEHGDQDFETWSGAYA
jgi:UDP-2,3-diacylglucosamine pyrophosphatase LpxH